MAYGLLRREHSEQAARSQALRSIWIERQRVLKWLRKSDHFTPTQATKLGLPFEEQWVPYWRISGLVLRKYTNVECTQALSLPSDPVYQLAKDLLQRAIDGATSDSIGITLRVHLENIPEGRAWPLRNIFHLVEEHLVEEWEREDTASAPPELCEIDWRILKALPQNGQPYKPVSALIAELQESKSPIYRSLAKLKGRGLVNHAGRKGYRLTALDTRWLP